jgi:hypothetical protein
LDGKLCNWGKVGERGRFDEGEAVQVAVTPKKVEVSEAFAAE